MALVKMSKTEFARQAGKVGIAPELYGAVLSKQFCGPDGYVSGGKVVGIVWANGWTTKEQYSPMRGRYTEKFLSRQPYVVLRKNRADFRVEAARVGIEASGKMHELLAEYVKSGKPL